MFNTNVSLAGSHGHFRPGDVGSSSYQQTSHPHHPVLSLSLTLYSSQTRPINRKGERQGMLQHTHTHTHTGNQNGTEKEGRTWTGRRRRAKL